MHKRLYEFECRSHRQLSELTTDLAALECQKINVIFFLVALDIILFKLADKEEMHYILEFEFPPDWTADNRVNCPSQGWDEHCQAGKFQWKMPENSGMANTPKITEVANTRIYE